MKDRLGILYDKEADVLYVSLGHPEHTEYVEMDDDFILRLDSASGTVVGFTVIDFAARFTSTQPILPVPLLADFERVPRSRGAKAIAEPRAPYRATPRRTKVTAKRGAKARKAA